MTLTAAQLSAALRLGNTTEETQEAARLLAFSTEAVTRYAPDAPDVVQNEAAIRLSGYLFDMPLAGRGAGYADALRNSGALQIVAGWRNHRAGSTAEGADAAATGTAGNPVTDVSVVGDDLLITKADGSTTTQPLPPDDDDDQTARDAAAAAQTAADAAGLRLLGTEAVVVAVVDEWVSTGLDYPSTTIFGVQVDEAPIALALTADLPDASVAAGADASGAIGSHPFAIGAPSAGDDLFFSASTVGTFTVRLYEHG